MSNARDRARHKISTFVTLLEKKGIRLLAVDFDETLISIHSGGCWKDSAEKLSQHVRPCMRDLMEEALQRNVNVCIVTYFTQPWIIREMLKLVFKRNVEKIYVQANTAEFREKNKHQILGKEAHLAAVCTELYNQKHVIIKPEEIILFDDDTDNIETAVNFGHWAVTVRDDISYLSFDDFCTMLKNSTSRKKAKS
ncbi:uncharacterized protein LOC110450653 [Mizuhopecten yessoensis]|uniref:Magnesium-dependent phosphatase 1 n=1 Tax=Mizuhopecten yessoensis TaxID=6573 RepID=A0A210QNI3_MIZYE|nr:uncharacterized protein LOC110450653 [Mizuhopecten yessoensis]OWF50268.1 hypothetical protein KP79_PYT16107 [Mizuhopecten yessoensis]